MNRALLGRWLPMVLILSLGLWSCENNSSGVITVQSGGGQGNSQGGGGPIDVVTLPDACRIEGSPDTLELITWNIEFFPKRNDLTVDSVAALVRDWDADVIALQEISDSRAFNELVSSLDGWDGILADDFLGLAYLFKTSEVRALRHFEVFTDDGWAFPRPPYLLEIEYGNQQRMTLVNLHLKCCGGSENFNRRLQASEKLKGYLDATMSETSVVVLGDYNDDLTDISGPTPFQNFLNDPQHYAFADMAIATGPISAWSYPSFPSHIDHIMVTDELFVDTKVAMTLEVDVCHPGYEAFVSDHRPVAVKIIKP